VLSRHGMPALSDRAVPLRSALPASVTDVFGQFCYRCLWTAPATESDFPADPI
jgi:hypothetical protein